MWLCRHQYLLINYYFQMVYELLPSVLEDLEEDLTSGNEQEPKSPTVVSDTDIISE